MTTERSLRRPWVDVLASISSRTLRAADSTITERKLDAERNAAVICVVHLCFAAATAAQKVAVESTDGPKRGELAAVRGGGRIDGWTEAR